MAQRSADRADHGAYERVLPAPRGAPILLRRAAGRIATTRGRPVPGQSAPGKLRRPLRARWNRRWRSIDALRRVAGRRDRGNARRLAPHRTGGAHAPGRPHPARRVYIALIFDQLDSAIFPRSGAAGSAQVFASSDALGADARYTKWDADGVAAWSFGDHTFNVGLKAGGKLGNDALPRYDLFQWGGFLQQSGYPTGALVTERLTFGRLMYYNKFIRQKLLEGVYAGFSLEAGKYGAPLVPGSPTGVLKSASVFLGADTPIGPLYFGYGHTADGNSSWYLFLGRP
jgi:outer membrane protein assembly factor BamA